MPHNSARNSFSHDQKNQPTSGLILGKEHDEYKRDRSDDLVQETSTKKSRTIEEIVSIKFATIFDEFTIHSAQAENGEIHPLLRLLFDRFIATEEALLLNNDSSLQTEKKVRFSTINFTAVETPTVKCLVSTIHFETLENNLALIMEVSHKIKNQIQIVKESSPLIKQIKLFQQYLSRRESFTNTEEKSIVYLQEVFDSFLTNDVNKVSNMAMRRAELISSLIRYEFKLLFKNTFEMKRKKTGNLSQNFEDLGAIFHHAIKMYHLCNDVMNEWSEVDLINDLISKGNKNINQTNDLNNETTHHSCDRTCADNLCEWFSPIIENLKTVKGSWAFMKPVHELWPDIGEHYKTCVVKPMDLGTLLKNLNTGIYDNVENILKDFRQIFCNAAVYNGEESDIVNVGKSVQRSFDSRLINHLIEMQDENSLEAYEAHICDLVSCISAVEFCDSVLSHRNPLSSSSSTEVNDQARHWKRITHFAKLAGSLNVEEVAYFQELQDLEAFAAAIRADFVRSRALAPKLKHHLCCLNKLRTAKKRPLLSEQAFLFPEVERITCRLPQFQRMVSLLTTK